jgi:hypothetical protein
MWAFLTNRLAIGFALAAMGLMGLTLAWNVNPVEGSVMPRFLHDSYFGMAGLWFLLVTCMPAWIVAVMVFQCCDDAGVSLPGLLLPVSQVLLQGILYFVSGAVASMLVRKLRQTRHAAR